MADTAMILNSAGSQQDSCEESSSEPRVDVFLDVPLRNRERLFIPPLNFAMVEKGVYRSGYPNRKSFSFLSNLGIRTIVCLVDVDSKSAEGEKILAENQNFIENEGINRSVLPIEAQKEPFTTCNVKRLCSALRCILNVKNHPVLVHCDRGKHQTGLVVACLRKLQGWALSSTFHEYSRFSKIKATRWLDHQFIEFFDIQFTEKEIRQLPDWMWLHNT